MRKKVTLHGAGHVDLTASAERRQARKKNVQSFGVRPLSGSPPWKVIFMSPCWFRGGLETVTINHLRLMDRELFDPHLLVGQLADGAADSLPEGVKMHIHSGCFEWDYPPAQSLTNRVSRISRDVIAKIAPDIIIGQLSHASMFGAKQAEVPIMAEYWHSSGGWDRLDHPSDLAIAVTQWTADAVGRVRHMVNTPVKVVLNGVDPALFHPPTDREEMRERYGISSDTSVVGFSGRVVKQKDPAAWMEIVAQVNQVRPVVAMICGPLHNPNIFNSISSVAAARGVRLIHESIRYENMHSFYGMMDVLLHTSVMETFGMILVEALMCGTPVVAYDVAAIPEVASHVADDERFRLVPGRSIPVAVREILSVLESRDRTVPENMGMFDAKNMSDNLKGILLEEIEKRVD